VARLRGHQVSLVEKAGRLGGKLHVSAAAPSKLEIPRFTNYLIHQVEKLGVSIELGCSLDAERLLRRRPEIVILATGSFPALPPLAGVDLPHVVVAEDVLLDRAPVGERVVVVGGGGTGCEVAEFLADRGHRVAILEMVAHIGMNIEAITRRWMYYQFRRAGVQLLTQSRLLRIEPGHVVYADRQGAEQRLDCDHVVIALGYRPNDDLAFCEDEGFPIPSYRIGDCEKPGTILDAVTAGAILAARI
jgi:NADPH-dependent 2,4-dienoyl-CoA reductase/sulfur reductase-like enzyme